MKEENEKTLLQKIVEQKANQIRIAIEQAIADGAKIEPFASGIKIDNVLVFKITEHAHSVVLHFESHKIEYAMLGNEREQLLAQKQQIENRLNELQK